MSPAATPALHHSRRATYTSMKASGVTLSDAARAIQNGPDRRGMPHSSSPTMSGWTLPIELIANSSSPNSRAARSAAGVPCRISGQMAQADATSMATDQAMTAASFGRKVSGIQAAANHGG